MKKHIPNIITLSNAFFGMVGILYAVKGMYWMALYMMIFAAIADFLDGFIARLLNVKSELGAELDSLSDLITFGALPGLIMYKLIESNTDSTWMPYIAFFITIMSAYRLAKFNISKNQSTNFSGLPTPINALVLASLSVIELTYLDNIWVLIGVCVLSGVLLVSNIPLIGLKFKSFGFKDNLAKYILVVVSIILIITLKIVAIPVILLSYIIISILHLKLKLI